MRAVHSCNSWLVSDYKEYHGFCVSHSKLLSEPYTEESGQTLKAPDEAAQLPLPRGY